MTSASKTTPFSTPLLALTECQIENRRRWASIALGAFRILLAVGLALWPADYAAMSGGDKFMLWFVKVGAWLAVNFIVTSALELLPALNPATYRWLPEDKCEAMAKLCERYEILAGYRAQVLAKSRRFTSGELTAMGEWSLNCHLADLRAGAEEKRRAACQRLYGVPAATETAQPATKTAVQ